MEKKTKRENFSTSIAVFFATLGSAVGLGNIWKFPYKTGMDGGGAFIFVYLICVAVVGLPLVISEFYIGRKTRKNVMGAVRTLKPKAPVWKTIGMFGILCAYLIMFFYSVISGWVYYYFFKALKGDFIGIDGNSIGKVFSDTISSPVAPILAQLAVMIVVSIILIAGVKNGIERVTKTLMPILFVLLIVCAIRSIMLPGAFAGVDFLLHVDFSKITMLVVLEAMGLAFFKLSIGMGTMVTYGSYFTEDNDMISTAFKVAISDIAVSLLAGLAIFPAIFSYKLSPESGPGLLFVSLPLVFSKIPLVGNLLLIAFFFLSGIAATTAMISMVEVLIAYFTEERGMSRTKAVLFNSIIIAAFSLLVNFGFQNKPFFSTINFTVLGRNLKGFMDIFDFVSSDILLPVGGLLIALLVGWFTNKKDIQDELSNHGTLNNTKIIRFYLVVLKILTPILLVIVLARGLIVGN